MGNSDIRVSRLGLDPKLLISIMNHSSGLNWATESYCPVEGVMDDVPAANNFENGFACELMLKDLNFAQKLAEEAGVPLIFASATQNLYRFVCEQGHKRKDFSVVSTLFKACGQPASNGQASHSGHHVPHASAHNNAHTNSKHRTSPQGHSHRLHAEVTLAKRHS